MLGELIKLNFLKKNANFEQINSIVELAAGIGLFASTLLQFKKSFFTPRGKFFVGTRQDRVAINFLCTMGEEKKESVLNKKNG